MDKNHVLILIFLALITYEEIQPCVKPEHVPHTPYAMPSYSLRPTMVMSTSALVMDVDWLKKL
jgi:hypothetical protein